MGGQGQLSLQAYIDPFVNFLCLLGVLLQSILAPGGQPPGAMPTSEKHPRMPPSLKHPYLSLSSAAFSASSSFCRAVASRSWALSSSSSTSWMRRLRAATSPSAWGGQRRR